MNKTQPITNRIADLRQWLKGPQLGLNGALAVLDEIDQSHADLLAACKAVLAGFRYEKGRPVMEEWRMKDVLAAAIARAEGE